ncbi:YXWGXW repeat-containing protein [Actimicrobium antarcticum]|uniref:YXWGXW repeat-containing protein n=1 Tax=Actimicrobium antarcticum TaxID=1051899 RepID=A0ABP7SUA9_9BURK
MKKILCAAAAMLAISSAMYLPTQAIAQVSVNIFLGEAPPPVRYERVPAPRNGYLWAPGYWNWNGNQHVWSNGHWERNRVDYFYSQPQWRQENDGWRLDRGGWKQDKKRYKEEYKREHKKDKHDHHDDDRGDRDDRDGHGDRGHCPPGQAKKGNC